jgi:hypothetical protein
VLLRDVVSLLVWAGVVVVVVAVVVVVYVFIRVVTWRKCNTPRLALGAGGALVSLPWLDRRALLGSAFSESGRCTGVLFGPEVLRVWRRRIFDDAGELSRDRVAAGRHGPACDALAEAWLSRAVELSAVELCASECDHDGMTGCRRRS